jgi:uncharacterized protein YndB with AHSA1/START domain
VGDLTWRLPPHVAVETETDASPAEVWDVLADVTRVGEWSHECRAADWLPGHRAAEVGAQFAGRNRRGAVRWGRRCTITEVDHERLLAYRTGGGFPPDSTEWRFELEPTASGGCVVRQSFQIIKLPLVTELMILTLIPAHRDRSAALEADLVRLGEIAAGRVPSS